MVRDVRRVRTLNGHHVYPGAEAFEVEFLMLDSRTAAVATIEAAALRRPRPNEITHSCHFR